MNIPGLFLVVAVAVAAPTQPPKGKTPELAVQFDGATCHHNEQAALALIAKGLDVNGTDPYGNTPLAQAAEFGDFAVVKELVARGADVHAAHGHESVMAAAIASRKPEMVTFMLDHGVDVNEPANDFGGTALMKAARLGLIDIVNLLLARGADIKGHDQAGIDALDEVVNSDHTDLITVLLDHGADPNRPGRNGQLPINEAARMGRLDAVKMFVAHGAKPDQPGGPDGFTPLADAACGAPRPGRDQVGVIEFLIKQGARVSPRLGKRSVTPLMLAMQEYAREDILRVLVAHGADVKSANGEGAQALRQLVQNDFQGNEEVPGAADKVKALLDVGANPNVTVLNDYSALFWAIEIKPDDKLVAVLAEGKANVNQTRSVAPMGEFVGGRPPNYVYSPLIAATKKGSAPMVRALLKAGADRDFKDSDGKTALDYARAANDAELVALLSTAST